MKRFKRLSGYQKGLLLLMAATLIVFLGIAWGAGTLADRLRSPRFQEALNRISAVIFLGLAVFTLIP